MRRRRRTMDSKMAVRIMTSLEKRFRRGNKLPPLLLLLLLMPAAVAPAVRYRRKASLVVARSARQLHRHFPPNPAHLVHHRLRSRHHLNLVRVRNHRHRLPELVLTSQVLLLSVVLNRPRKRVPGEILVPLVARRRKAAVAVPGAAALVVVVVVLLAAVEERRLPPQELVVRLVVFTEWPNRRVDPIQITRRTSRITCSNRDRN